MARKNFDGVMTSYLSQPVVTQPAESDKQGNGEKAQDTMPMATPIVSETAPTQEPVVAPSSGGASRKKTDAPAKKQKGFYITLEQEKQLKRAAFERDTDISTIVREALDMYFKNS